MFARLFFIIHPTRHCDMDEKSLTYFFSFPPLRAARGFSLTRVYAFLSRATSLILYMYKKKGGNCWRVSDTPRERNTTIVFSVVKRKKMGEEEDECCFSLWGDGKIKIKLLPAALLKDICLRNERNLFSLLPRSIFSPVGLTNQIFLK